MVRTHPGKSGIVFCETENRCDLLLQLTERRIISEGEQETGLKFNEAEVYYSREGSTLLESRLRRLGLVADANVEASGSDSEEEEDPLRVLYSTVALSRGANPCNVGWTVHLDMPGFVPRQLTHANAHTNKHMHSSPAT